MKARNPSTGQFETVYVKALDSMPVGTIVDYDGQASDIPTGWETYGTGQIKKTATNLPNDYNELVIYVKLSTYDEIFSIHIIKDYVQTTTRKQIMSGVEGYVAYANVNETQIVETGIIKNGSTQTSATYDVYYR